MYKRNYMLLKTLFIVFCTILVAFSSTKLMADGDETLGSPSISILAGSGIVIAGAGLFTQPGTIEFDVPLGAAIKQVILYWEGQMWGSSGDETIKVNGDDVTGQLIGGPTNFYSWVYSSCYRADITNLNLVAPGFNSLEISDGDFDRISNGAGVIVIFDDGSGSTDIQIRDGLDLAFINSPEPDIKVTVAQTLYFDPADSDRMANLAMFFSSVSGTTSTGTFRPSSIEIIVDGDKTTYSDELDSHDGQEWDSLNKSVWIPAGASSLTIQAFSRDDHASGRTPASFAWIGAFLSLPLLGDQGCTPGFWKQEQHFDSWVDLLPGDKFSDPDIFDRTITVKWSSKGKPQDTEDPTLLQALEAKGGDINALARHAVAALLNAYRLGANFAFTPAQVIAEVQFALDSGDSDIIETTKNMFERANESGCPLD